MHKRNSYHNDDILYVSLSWYVKLYLEFLVILPLLKYISQRIHSVISELLLFVLVPIQLVHFLPDAEEFYLGKTVFVLSSVRLLLTWLPVFCTGIILAKYKFFEYISPLNRKNDFRFLKDSLVSKVLFSVFTLLCIVYFLQIRGTNCFGVPTELVCTVLILIVYDFGYKMNYFPSGLLAFLGKYSFQYWLLSGMFFLNTPELQWVLAMPKYSVLCLVWNFIILTPFAIVLSKISEKIYQMLMLIQRKGSDFFGRSDTICEKIP